MSFDLDIPTSSGVAHADAAAPGCGDPLALRQMLFDLGFYHGALAADHMTAADVLELSTALLAYINSKGVPAGTSGLLICQMLLSDWQTKKTSDTTKTVLIVFGILGLGAAIYVATKSRRW